jgi:hypothetical protein
MGSGLGYHVYEHRCDLIALINFTSRSPPLLGLGIVINPVSDTA